MKYFMLTIVGLFIIICKAEDKKDHSKYQTFDMKQFDNVNSENESSGIKLSVTCKNEDGKEIKSTEPEYQSCLEKTKRKIKSEGM